MPVFDGVVVAFFAWTVSWAASRMALGIAVGLAAIATVLAAVAVLRVSLHLIWSGVSLVAPDIVIQAFAMVMPGNFAGFVTGIVLVDVCRAAYDYWIQSISTASAVKSFIV